MLTQEQKENRKKGLGGTDIAALFGVSPWKTPYELYLEKTVGSLQDDKPTEQMNWGNWLEDGIAKGYEHITGQVVQECDTIHHPEHPIFFANPDRLLKGKKKGLEIKNVSTFLTDEWGDAGTQKIPQHYFLQIAHYMFVTGYEEWDVAALFGGNKLQIYTFQHDKAFDELIQEEGLKFWKEHVVKEMPPPATFTKRSVEFLKKHFKNVDEKTVFLDRKLTEWKETFLKGKEIIKRADEEVKVASAHILNAMGEANKAVLTDGSCFLRQIVNVKPYQVSERQDVRLRYKQ